MPDRTQDIKNLRAVATACKNYTDKSIDNLRWELGTYDLGVDTVNGSTMLLPTPANTIQATMVRIDGASEVSANLKDLSYPTINYYRNNLTTFIATTDTSTTRIRTESVPFKASNGAEYYINNIPSNITLLGVGAFDTNQTRIENAISNVGNKITINTSGVEYIFLLFGGSDFDDNTKTLFNQIGILKTNTYEPYFDGIHNLELSGLKVEGSNIAPLDNQEYSKTFGSQYSVYNIPFITTITLKKGITYSWSIKIKGDGSSRFNKAGLGLNNSSIGITTSSIYQVVGTSYTTYTFTFTAENDVSPTSIWLQTVTADATFTFKEFILNYGSTALAYVPYITPTTLPIDLTSIEDSGGNKLFADGKLRGNSGIYDIITPNYQEKKWNEIVLNSSENWSKSGTTQVDRFLLPIDNAVSSQTVNYTPIIDNQRFTHSAGSLSENTFYISFDLKIVINFSAYGTTSLADFKTWLSNNNLTIQYLMETHLTSNTDLSQLVKFEAHSNGSITLVNTNNQDTTSTFKYLKEVAK